MHQDNHRRLPPRRLLIAAAVVAGAVLVAFLFVSPGTEDPNASLPRLAAGQLVEDSGEFRFPAGNRTLQVSEDIDGNVHIAVHVQSSVVFCIPFTRLPYRRDVRSSIESRIVVESERECFVAVDQYERLWVYYGRWDPEWGELRELPGGGTRPYAPAVIRHGLNVLPSGTLAVGSEVVTETGNWAGVPAAFLERVRDESSVETDGVDGIPGVAPMFTPEQEEQIARRLELAE